MSTARTRLVGGPYGNQTGEVVTPPPHVLDFHGFVYRLRGQVGGKDPRCVYGYAPDLSPAHARVVQADRDAVLEVAAKTGRSPAEVIALAEARRVAAQEAEHPAQMLLDEADRLGVDVSVLLEERDLVTHRTDTTEVSL